MSSYYANFTKELAAVGIKPDELALYTGSVRSGLRGGPSESDSRNAYTYWWQENGFQELNACFLYNELETSIKGEQYIFLRNEAGNFIRQVSGPAKPVVIGNIGAEAVRVDTLLGKFLVPAGTVLRLDRDAPLQREKKKVLLTFFDKAGCENHLESALVLEGGHWKPLNICADRNGAKVRDGSFTVQTLTLRSRGDNDVKLEDPPVESDYEVYFRSMTTWFEVRFAGVGMKDEGLARKHHTFTLKQNKIYDFQRLRQAPSTKLMRQCTARLPGLEEVDGRPGDGQGEETPADWPALCELPAPSSDGADTPDIK